MTASSMDGTAKVSFLSLIRRQLSTTRAASAAPVHSSFVLSALSIFTGSDSSAALSKARALLKSSISGLSMGIEARFFSRDASSSGDGSSKAEDAKWVLIATRTLWRASLASLWLPGGFELRIFSRYSDAVLQSSGY
eukprot:Amastigsp_a680195_6.p4 type:complete len:137 gc:universal Amastigsp_a680195_6:981-571(-)